MDLVYIGDVVNTHGIKGEIKIISSFKEKSKVFKKDNIVYLGRLQEPRKINTYRTHKNYDMITLDGINDINDAIIYKGDSVYINRENIELDNLVLEDYLNCIVYVGDNEIGKVTDILNNKAHDILEIKKNNKNYYIPLVDEFINKVDVKNKIILVNDMKGLINED